MIKNLFELFQIINWKYALIIIMVDLIMDVTRGLWSIYIDRRLAAAPSGYFERRRAFKDLCRAKRKRERLIKAKDMSVFKLIKKRLLRALQRTEQKIRFIEKYLDDIPPNKKGN